MTLFLFNPFSPFYTVRFFPFNGLFLFKFRAHHISSGLDFQFFFSFTNIFFLVLKIEKNDLMKNS